MRITTQMLNESAKKAGLPIHQSSLLNYINQGGNYSSAFEEWQSKAVSTANKTKYEKQEKAAEGLVEQLQKFRTEEGENIFEKARKTGDTTELCEAIEKLAEKYNALTATLDDSKDTMNVFYKQYMSELVDDNGEALEGIGISKGKNGKLTVDKDKLKASSVDDLEKVFGEKNPLLSKLAFLTTSIGSNASASLDSISSGYLSDGSSVSGNSYSKYDFKG